MQKKTTDEPSAAKPQPSSAEWNSAVSQIGNLRTSKAQIVGSIRRLPIGDTADYQSALQFCAAGAKFQR
jgi:hypothetical protein